MITGLIIPVLPFTLALTASVRPEDLQRCIGILLAAYGAGALIGAPVTGYLASRSSSRKPFFLGGLALLLISMIAFSFGRTFSLLVAGRFVQGASAASVHTVGIALLADVFADGGMGFIRGVVDLSMALVTVAGPVMGGLIYQGLGYNAVFGSAYAVIATDIVLRILISEGGHHHSENTGKRDSPEALLINGCDSSDVNSVRGEEESPPTIAYTKIYGTNAPSGPDHTGNSSCTNPSSNANNESLRKVCRDSIKRLGQSQIIDLLLLPRMQTALLADFVQSVIIAGLESTLPIRIEAVFDYNAKEIALLFLVMSFPSVTSPIIGHLGDRLGPKNMVTTAMLVLGPVLIALRIICHRSREQLALLCVLLFFIGLSLNLILTPIFLDVTYLIDDRGADKYSDLGEKKGYAQVYALMGIAYSCGNLIGSLLGGLESSLGWDALTLSAGLLCVLCAAPCFLFLGGKKLKSGLDHYQ